MTGSQEPKQPGNVQRRLPLFQTFTPMIPLLAINVCYPYPGTARWRRNPMELIER
jgi:hypothetical protein